MTHNCGIHKEVCQIAVKHVQNTFIITTSVNNGKISVTIQISKDEMITEMTTKRLFEMN